MQDLITEETGGSNSLSVSIIESAYKAFLGREVTYTVAYYGVDADKLTTSVDIRSLKKSEAAKHEALTRLGTAEIILDSRTEEVISIEYTAANCDH